MKHCQSQSRRHEQRLMLPFPLQDSEGRLASISQLYEHAGEQPATRHNVASQGIMHLHPEMLQRKATCLRNQVICMIAEYYLTGSARGPSSLSPILWEEAAALLPHLCKPQHICRATGMEEGPKVTLDIQCLRRGGRAALTLMNNYFLH